MNRAFLADMDTISAGSVFNTHRAYRELAINRLPTLILGQPPSTDIHSLLEQPWSDHRTQIGVTLLQRLAETRILYSWTRNGLVANTKFKVELLARVLRDASYVTCQHGAAIAVGAWL